MASDRISKKHASIQSTLDYWHSQNLLQDVPSESYNEIIRATASKIVHKITEERSWTAEQVMRVICHSALATHDKLNCLTEIMFERAIKMAQHLDEEFNQTGKPRGKLHGIPISLKDQFHVKGFDATSGYSKFCGKPCEEDGVFIQILESQGAICFVKTNVPQTLMTFDCSNPLFGRTFNPHNDKFSPGGSTGGEAALIASYGSCLGVGGDVGGSLRIPAHFCGIYSLKPTAGRLPLSDCTTGFNGSTHILVTSGPMARCVEDLELFMEAVIETRPIDLDYRVRFHEPFVKYSFDKPKLRIGYYNNDGLIFPAPCCSRAVDICVDALRKDGHELVPFKIPRIEDGFKIFFQWVAADGLKTYYKSLEADPRETAWRKVDMLARTPNFVKDILRFFLRLAGEKRAAEIMGISYEISVSMLYELHHQQELYFKDFSREWKESGVDFVIAPGFGSPAIPHNSFSDTSVGAWYTALYNMINYSVGAMPVTKVDKDIDRITLNAQKRFDLVDKLRFKHYDPVKCHGLPVGVQVIGGYKQDEKTLAAMKLVQKCLDKYRNLK